MLKKRPFMILLSVIVIFLATALTLPQFAQPTQASEDSPESSWLPKNYTPPLAPWSACSFVEEFDKQLTMLVQLPMVQWQGVGFLPVTARFLFYRWPGYQTNTWPLVAASETYVSQSNMWSPSFSFWYSTYTIGDSLFGCVGPCYNPGALYFTPKPGSALIPGTYFVKLQLDQIGTVTEYTVPFIGDQSRGTYFCSDPNQPSPWNGVQSGNVQFDPNNIPSELNATSAGEPPPAPRFDNYLPLAARSLIGSLQPTPPPQPTATPTIPLLPTPSLPSTTTGIGDPGFESVPDSAWAQYSSSGFDILLPGKDDFLPRNGDWMAWLGGANDEFSAITQTLSIPDTHPFLSFYALVTSEEDQCYYDHARVVVNEQVVAEFRFCKANKFHSWTRGYIDLRAFTGQEVTFSILMDNDESLLSSLFLDDFTFESGIETGSASPTPGPSPTSTPPTPTPTPTATQPAPSPTPTPTSTPTPQPAILNPGFELGDNGDWTTYSQGGYPIMYQSGSAHSGSWLAYLGGADGEVAYIEQTVNVPADKPYLTLWLWIYSQDVCGYDFMSYRANSTPFFTYNLCTQTNTNGWVPHAMDLSNYAGGPVTIQVRVTTDSSDQSSLYLDDFVFSASPPTGTGSGDGIPPADQGDQLSPPDGLDLKVINR